MLNSSQQNWRQHLAAQGRLVSRPIYPFEPTNQSKLGLQAVEVQGNQVGMLYVPPTYSASQPAPLILMLHGAGGNAQQGIAPFHPLADQYGLILLGISSQDRTWDVIVDHYGPDVAILDRALTQIFDRYAIDPNHVAIEGFSDGASYALSLGISNGDLLTHIIAFSPGFMVPTVTEGAPRLFISHGQRDNVLPISRCSRRIVAQLQQTDYNVHYQEFDGPHTVPPAIAKAALDWLTTA